MAYDRKQHYRYTNVAIFLHWISALLIVFQLALGLFMTRGTTDLFLKFELYQLHKSLGFTLLAITLLRALWRLTHKAPSHENNLPVWMTKSANYMHGTLYMLLFCIPLSGWVMVSTAEIDIPTHYFGWFEIPHLSVSRGSDAENLSTTLHTVLVSILGVLAVTHIAAAAFHTLILNDNTVRRMFPGTPRNPCGTRR